MVLKDKGLHFMAHSNFQIAYFISIIYGPYFFLWMHPDMCQAAIYSARADICFWCMRGNTCTHTPVSITQRASFPRADCQISQMEQGGVGYTAGCRAISFPQEMCFLMRSQHCLLNSHSLAAHTKTVYNQNTRYK